MFSFAYSAATVSDVMGLPRSAWTRPGLMPSLAAMACSMNSFASSPVSDGQISQWMALRDQMSMMTYRQYQVPRYGPRSFVMSQLHTSFGPRATISGFFFAGWVAWRRRSPAVPRSRSSRCMVDCEHR